MQSANCNATFSHGFARLPSAQLVDAFLCTSWWARPTICDLLQGSCISFASSLRNEGFASIICSIIWHMASFNHVIPRNRWCRTVEVEAPSCNYFWSTNVPLKKKFPIYGLILKDFSLIHDLKKIPGDLLTIDSSRITCRTFSNFHEICWVQFLTERSFIPFIHINSQLKGFLLNWLRSIVKQSSIEICWNQLSIKQPPIESAYIAN